MADLTLSRDCNWSWLACLLDRNLQCKNHHFHHFLSLFLSFHTPVANRLMIWKQRYQCIKPSKYRHLQKKTLKMMTWKHRLKLAYQTPLNLLFTRPRVKTRLNEKLKTSHSYRCYQINQCHLLNFNQLYLT